MVALHLSNQATKLKTLVIQQLMLNLSQQRLNRKADQHYSKLLRRKTFALMRYGSRKMHILKENFDCLWTKMKLHQVRRLNLLTWHHITVKKQSRRRIFNEKLQYFLMKRYLAAIVSACIAHKQTKIQKTRARNFNESSLIRRSYSALRVYLESDEV